MKKANYLLLCVFFLTINLIQAQEGKPTKFNIIGSGGIGYGVVKNDNEPNYNLNSSSGGVLFSYKFHQYFGIATGMGVNDLSGNGFNSIGNFYHERKLLKIPLLATMDLKFSEKIRVIGDFGLYAQNITKDEYKFLSHTQKDIYSGWNFGSQMEVGFVMTLIPNFSLGIIYSVQRDFSQFKTKDNQVINDKQKLDNLPSIGMLLVIGI